jgi:hypothetical protein
MRSTPKPTKTPTPPRLFLTACATASALAMTSCASGPVVADPAPAPQLEQPAFTREDCPVTVARGSALADLETAYRARGVDVEACNAKRALAVQVHDAEHELEAKAATIRAQRNGWFCRTFGWGCPKAP